MRIAFDAKRAFQNFTGLGHYSRTLLTSIFEGFAEHEYYLMAPKKTDRFDASQYNNVHIIEPSGISSSLRSIWRANLMKTDLKKLKIDLYHGLSNEIPLGIHKTGIKTVVTIHDLIFERYAHHDGAIDTAIYRSKFKYACKKADKVIAISKQTRDDIVEFYNIDPQKIEVCYQSCNAIFQLLLREEEKEAVRARYGLPKEYFLYVGSVVDRKNLLTICKAMKLLQNKLSIPLVVIGSGGSYFQKVKQYITENRLEESIIFLSEQEYAANEPRYKNSLDFPAIYQMATAMIYPSVYEGFGLPVLEALWSAIPVITSDQSSLVEVGGDAACLIDPMDEQLMANEMYDIATNAERRSTMIEKGLQHAQNFTPESCAAKVMEVYESIL
ncbi:MAG: glycosyltransferase family 1 protein [Flavipsychrobacter sp.]